MSDGNEKTILSLYFISGLSSEDIIQHCKDHAVCSRSHTNYSTRSIQNIVGKYFPEVKQYRRPNRENEKRREHYVFLKEHKEEKRSCAKCGSTENLEFHHEIPLDMGGTTCDENIVVLCRSCHQRVTAYHRKMGFIRSNS
jgi:5-methylcytosine-specific restriction endonuclease McrA